MKKLGIVILVLMLVLGCFCLTACDSIMGIEITVYTNGIAATYKAGLKKTVSIDPGVKQGYYLKGYYSAEQGGEKYFDVNGESVMTWNKSFPTIFYAQWESIEGFESEVGSWEDKTFYAHFGSATSSPGTKFGWEIKDEASNLVMGNPETFLQIRVCGKIKAPVTINMLIQDSNGSNAEVYYSTQLSDITPSKTYYQDFNVVAYCPAKIFKNNKLYVNFLGGFSFSDSHLKDLTISFSVPRGANY